MMPVIGKLVTKVETRLLIGFGFLISGLGAYTMVYFNLQTDYDTIMWSRILQTFCLPFLFIPINTAAFDGLPSDKSSDASAIINLARNIGGSIGISLCTTMIARRTQFHQERLVDGLTPYHPQMQEHLTQLSHTGLDAHNLLYQQVLQQAAMLSYLDIFQILALLFLVMVPLVFVIRRGISGAVMGAH